MIYHAPTNLNNLTGITAGITLANRDRFNQSEAISGLNFGENTNVPIYLVKKNLRLLNEELQHNGEIALAEQVHGSDIKVVSEAGYYTGVDGLLTTTPELLICIKVADCAAILLSDSVAGVVAAVHAGWRGAAAGILPKAIGMMSDQGSSPENIECYISPCISLENFEIGEEVAEQFPSQFIDLSFGIKPHLDLKAFLKNQLKEADITESNIDADSRCTINDSSFYSHRRERGDAGRMLAFIKRT